jgi:hypothetical protein
MVRDFQVSAYPESCNTGKPDPPQNPPRGMDVEIIRPAQFIARHKL